VGRVVGSVETQCSYRTDQFRRQIQGSISKYRVGKRLGRIRKGSKVELSILEATGGYLHLNLN
jgi:hypothetical protein